MSHRSRRRSEPWQGLLTVFFVGWPEPRHGTTSGCSARDSADARTSALSEYHGSAWIDPTNRALYRGLLA